MDYHMHVSRIPYPSPLTWTIICTLWNLFHFSKNVYYHMQCLEFLCLLQKHGLSYAIFGISFPSPETWTFICNLLEFLYLLQKHGLSYVIYRISFFSPKIWTIICNFWKFFHFLYDMEYHIQYQ